MNFCRYQCFSVLILRYQCFSVLILHCCSSVAIYLYCCYCVFCCTRLFFYYSSSLFYYCYFSTIAVPTLFYYCHLSTILPLLFSTIAIAVPTQLLLLLFPHCSCTSIVSESSNSTAATTLLYLTLFLEIVSPLL